MLDHLQSAIRAKSSRYVDHDSTIKGSIKRVLFRSKRQKEKLAPQNASEPNLNRACSADSELAASGAFTPETTPGANLQPTEESSWEDFKMISVLGRGHFGKVLLTKHKHRGEYFAVKVLKRPAIKDMNNLDVERRVLALGHPLMTGLFACLQTNENVSFVMEYAAGGDLMNRIREEQFFSEDRSCFYASCVVLALEFLHSRSIIYRDIKFENLLLGRDGYIKLTDFGLCKEGIGPNDRTNTFCGTPEFFAPEILTEESYTRSVDWWALGILIFEMLVGEPPFSGDDNEELYDNIVNEKLLYPRFLSKDAVSIMRRLLSRNVQKRLGSGETGAKEVKQQPFFKGIKFKWDKILNKRFKPVFVPNISHPEDVSNFERNFTEEHLSVEPYKPLSASDGELFSDFDSPSRELYCSQASVLN